MIKVVASDAPDNPNGQKLTGERISELVDIDNTPPGIKVMQQPQVARESVRVVFVVDDATGKIKKADASLDGTAWLPVFPEDGIADSGHEVYAVEFGALSPGEHTISLRSFDSSGNVGTERDDPTIGKEHADFGFWGFRIGCKQLSVAGGPLGYLSCSITQNSKSEIPNPKSQTLHHNVRILSKRCDFSGSLVNFPHKMAALVALA